MRGSARGVLLVMLAVAGAVFAWSTAWADTTSSGNQAAAQSDAASLLADVKLPADATQSATEPAGDDGFLSGPATTSATPNEVDDSGWWTASESPAAVLDYLKAKPPSGGTLMLSGSSSGPKEPTNGYVGFSWPAITGELSQRWLLVEVVQLSDGSTGIRADGQDVWITPRPSSEVVPGGADTLTISDTGMNGKTLYPTFNVTSSQEISQVVALINALPADQPGTVSCPADVGTTIGLAFTQSGTTTPLAQVAYDPGGCEGVSLSLNGQSQPGLTDEPFPGSGLPTNSSLVEQLNAALGVNLPTYPGESTPTTTTPPAASTVARWLAPLLTLSATTGTIPAILRHSDYVATFKATIPGTVKVTWTRHGVLLAAVTAATHSPSTTVPIKLTRAGNALLKRDQRILVKAVATFSYRVGGAVHFWTESRTLTLSPGRTTG